MWHSVEDAAMRLTGCVVQYDGEPVYVCGVFQSPESGIYTKISRLGKVGELRVSINKPEWDFTPVPTGYINYEKRCFYVSRVPIRKWKQGLHHDNVRVLPQLEDPMALVRTSEFRNVVLNVYPSFQEVLSSLELGFRSQAFSRKFCLHKIQMSDGVSLLYMGHEVGSVVRGVCSLDKEYRFLEEELKESVLKEAKV